MLFKNSILGDTPLPGLPKASFFSNLFTKKPMSIHMLSTLALAQKEKVASFIDTIGVNDEGLNKMNTIRSESVANKNPSY